MRLHDDFAFSPANPTDDPHTLEVTVGLTRSAELRLELLAVLLNTATRLCPDWLTLDIELGTPPAQPASDAKTAAGAR